jgi:hypothetical protein
MRKMTQQLAAILLLALSSSTLLLSSCHGFVVQSPTTTKSCCHHPRMVIASTTKRSSALPMVSSRLKEPGTAQLDTPWAELGFEFRPTNSHIKLTWKDGEWGIPELVKVRTVGHYNTCMHGNRLYCTMVMIIPDPFDFISYHTLPMSLCHYTYIHYKGTVHQSSYWSHSVALWSSLFRRTESLCPCRWFGTFISGR